MPNIIKPLAELAARFRGFAAFAAFAMLAIIALFVWLFGAGSFDPIVANFSQLSREQFFWLAIIVLILFFVFFSLLAVLAYRRTGPATAREAIVYVIVHEKGDKTAGIGEAEVVLALPEPIRKKSLDNGSTPFIVPHSLVGRKFEINARKEGYKDRRPSKIELRDGMQEFLPLERIQQSTSADETKAEISWHDLQPEYLEPFTTFGQSPENSKHIWGGGLKFGQDGVWTGEIINGTYRLLNTSGPNDAKYYHIGLVGKDISNAVVSVEVKVEANDSSPEFSGSGLLYRFNRQSKFYYAFIINNQTFTFYKRNTFGYQSIFSGRSETIRVGSFNKFSESRIGVKRTRTQ